MSTHSTYTVVRGYKLAALTPWQAVSGCVHSRFIRVVSYVKCMNDTCESMLEF